MMDLRRAGLSGEGESRPIAIWILLICNGLVALPALWGLWQTHGVSTADTEWVPIPTVWETGRAPYVFAVGVLTLASAFLCWLGFSIARPFLVAATMAYGPIFVIVIANDTYQLLREAQLNWTNRNWMEAVALISVSVLWLAFTVWSLFGARSRSFFRPRHHHG